MKEIKLSQWGMSMMEGTVTEWFVAPGDEVEVGQELAQVESSKTSNTLESIHAGIVHEILVAEGETVPVNTVLVTLLEPGEDAAGTSPSAVAPESAGPAADTSTVSSPLSPTPPARRGEVQVVPLARKLAREHGIDLTTVAGSGPRGRVVPADVQALIDARSRAPQTGAADTVSPLSQMRRIIGRRMVESLQNSAQLTLVSTADVTALAPWRVARPAGSPKPSVTDAVIRACALALRRHPGVNARIDGEHIVELGAIHIGMAVALEHGLVVPVIRDADTLSVDELSTVSADLAAKARARQLGPDDYDGGTFTVTNLGAQGIDAFTPVLNLPQAAILGVGRTREVPVRDGGGISWRSEMTLSLTIDHRLIDGHPGALFLADVVTLLEDPTQL